MFQIGERKRQRETETETDRQTDRQKVRESERETECFKSHRETKEKWQLCADFTV